MIEKELSEALKNDSNGELLNDFVDTFREGRDRSELLQLLRSHDDEIKLFSIYIVNEIRIGNQKIEKEITEELYDLLNHKSFSIRLQAFITLLPLLKKQNREEAKNICRKMMKDENKHIKEKASLLFHEKFSDQA